MIVQKKKFVWFETLNVTFEDSKQFMKKATLKTCSLNSEVFIEDRNYKNNMYSHTLTMVVTVTLSETALLLGVFTSSIFVIGDIPTRTNLLANELFW